MEGGQLGRSYSVRRCHHPFSVVFNLGVTRISNLNPRPFGCTVKPSRKVGMTGFARLCCYSRLILRATGGEPERVLFQGLLVMPMDSRWTAKLCSSGLFVSD